jgi:hypothetical protein
VQTALDEILKREEQKNLYEAFSQVGQDSETSDVTFALHAQQEVARDHD